MNAQTPIDTAAATPLPAPALPRQDLPQIAAGLVAAYVRGNSLPATELPGLIRLVHATLQRIADPGPEISIVRPTDAEIRASIRPDTIVSFEDGKPYKALRRHLTLRGLTREAYRRKWGLPFDYPMVADAYSARRSEISHGIAQASGIRSRSASSGEAVPAAGDAEA